MIAFITTAGPRALVSADNRAASQAVAQAPTLDRGLIITADLTASPAANAVDAPTVGALADAFAGELPSAQHFPAAQHWAGLTFRTLVVDNPAPSAVDDAPPIAEIAYRADLARNSVIVAGSLPAGEVALRSASAGRAMALGIAVTPAIAARFSLRVGSLVELGSAASGGPLIRLLVTGIVRPAPASSAFWQIDPNISTPTRDVTSEAPFWQAGFIAGPGDLAALNAAYASQTEIATWFFPISPALTAAEIPRLEAGMAAFASQPTARQAEISHGAGVLTNTAISSGLADGLATFTAQWDGTSGPNSVLVLGLTVAGIILLLICGGLATEAYRPELVLLRVRGASLRQLAGRAFARTCCITLPALACGAAIAIAILPDGSTTVSLDLLGLTALAAVAGTPVICVLAHRRPQLAAPSQRADMVVLRPSSRRLVAELMVLLVAAGAIADLRFRGTGQGTTGPYLSASVVLVAAAVGLALNRAYRGPLRALAAVAATRRGPVGFVGLARAAGSRVGSVLPAFVLMLTLTLTAFGAMVVASISAGQVAVSWAQVGADVTVSAASTSTVTSADLSAIEKVPGVRHAAAVYTAPSVGPLAVNLASAKSPGAPLGVAVVDPAGYGALSADTPWPGFPVRAMQRPASGPAAVVPILVTPDVASRHRSGRLRLEFGGLGIPVRIVGTITDTAAMPSGGSYVLMPSWAAPRLPSLPGPSAVLLTGASIDLPALRATVARVLPGSQLTVRSQVLSQLEAEPALHVSERLYLVGALTAAVLSVLAVLFALASSARSRAITATRLAALGMARRQAFVLGLTDATTLLAVAVIGTVASSWLLVEVIGPVLGLNVFTGSSAPLALQPTWQALVVPLGGAAVLAMAFLTIDGILSGRREIGAALRQEEAV
jgi:putative ABC transport system permease protein